MSNSYPSISTICFLNYTSNFNRYKLKADHLQLPTCRLYVARHMARNIPEHPFIEHNLNNLP